MPATADDVREVLKTINDPEINYNIVDLGLVYNIEVDDQGSAHVLMTLTTPACPIGPMIMEQINENVSLLPGIKEVDIEFTFSPLWNPGMMTDDAKEDLGIDY
ncbi:MAG TPA: metal-sulfur cluster assembly factor [Dehalococcoidia bacterium]|nr:metal-sulfur cluster assembly factor [Dehalococcoidia bacterium]